MITLTHNVRLDSGQALYLAPIGDVHYNSEACNRSLFKSEVQRLVSLQKAGDKVMLLGTGDYLDSLSGSERSALVSAKGGAGLHDSSLASFDRWVLKDSRDFLKAVEPLKDSFLGLCEGHHYMRFNFEPFGGSTTTEYMARELGTAYFGVGALVELRIGKHRLQVYISHGTGGGSTEAGRLNRLIKQSRAFPNADVIILGHTHSRIAHLGHALDMVNGRQVFKDRFYINAGSFLSSYDKTSKGTYVEHAGLAPSALGLVLLKITVEKGRLVMHAIL